MQFENDVPECLAWTWDGQLKLKAARAEWLLGAALKAAAADKARTIAGTLPREEPRVFYDAHAARQLDVGLTGETGLLTILPMLRSRPWSASSAANWQPSMSDPRWLTVCSAAQAASLSNSISARSF